LVDPPAAGIEAKVVDDRYRLESERAVAVAQCDIDAVVAEADNVRAAFCSHVREKARVLVDAPASGFEAEVRKHKLRRLERTVAVAQSDIDACIAEPNDVRAAVAGDVREKSRVLVDAPAAGFLTKVGKHESNGSKRTVAIAERNIDSRVAEPDDVRATVAGDVREKARVLVDAPASRLLPEVRDDEPHLLERAVAVAERDVYAGIAEPDDARATVPGHAREKARVLVDAPAAGFEAKVRDHELRRLKSAVAVAEGDVDARVSKTDDIGAAIATEVGE